MLVYIYIMHPCVWLEEHVKWKEQPVDGTESGWSVLNGVQGIGSGGGAGCESGQQEVFEFTCSLQDP